jgi:hypothetical protein
MTARRKVAETWSCSGRIRSFAAVVTAVKRSSSVARGDATAVEIVTE